LNPEETQEISEFLSRIDWPYDQINKLYTNLVKDQVDADTVRESFGRLSSCESNLVTANRRLIGVAIKNLRRTSFREALLALDHEERESQGLTSLSRAVRLFEPKTLMRFATYAVATISNNFKTALRAEMRSRGKLPKISLDEPIGENNGDTKASVIPASPQADSISQKALISWHAAVIESLIEALFALPVEYRDAYISQNSNIQELLERSGISCGVACTSERKGKEDLIKRWLCRLDYQAFRRLRVLGKNKEDPGPPPEIGERIMARPVASLDLDLAPLRIKNIFLMELTIGMFVDMSLGELKRKPYNLKCDEIGIIIDSIRRNPQINDHVPRLRIASEGLV
jgi:uncharacterized membrane protein